MPLFAKNAFKSGRKPSKRKSASLSNISSLDESTYSVNELRLEAGPLTLKLGGNELIFDKGNWTPVSRDKSVTLNASEEDYRKVLEENNLLKYKVELLLDMLAASNADNFVLQKELEDLKKKRKQ